VRDEAATYVAITKKAEYAITILLDLALQPDNRFTTAKEIAERQGIPCTFVPQIVSILSRVGWVEAMRGPGGGVRLATELGELNIREVIETVDGPITITRCLLDDETICSNRPLCPLHEVWVRAQEAMLKVLDDTSIADLVESKQDLMANTGT
jgi:Rrf2 family iron-sulfur cluster assembly transcriptional regulator